MPAGPMFRDLELPETLLRVLEEVGYETPSPIQAQTIPPLLQGRDVLGQAQTGTGKTAAFALPALARTDLFHAVPQTLVLAPTRELAIQVAEAFQKYATHLAGFRVLPIYGGQSYEPQLKGLRRGVHAVVGTPGRVVDHVKRGTLKLDQIKMLVLDEADEMLRMGFIEDVEWVLEQMPPERQIALFSATMPSVIKRVAQTHLRNPAEIHVKAKTTTATNIRQRYWMAAGAGKLEGLTRILEAETFDGMLIFTRTKIATTELADKLEARGFNVAALNGDLDQKQRERTIQRLKDGTLDIIVATDVAARGLDVERISHVVNYDIPTDTESYVHRIGRTGRAGRSGEAILFIAPREQHLLRAIERATRQTITQMQLPSEQAVQSKRVERFRQSILDVLGDDTANAELARAQQLIEDMEREQSVPVARIAAALAKLAAGQKSLVIPEATVKGFVPPTTSKAERFEAAQAARESRTLPPSASSARREREQRERNAERNAVEVPKAPPPKQFFVPPVAAATEVPKPAPIPSPHPIRERLKRREAGDEDTATETYRVEVGEQHGIKPGNLVGAIANEAGLDGANIGKIVINADHSLVDLPVGMPKKIFRDLQKVWVAGQQLRISRVEGGPARPGGKPPHKGPRRD
ncbi:DEAD/DEAH box helicase [Panacagrimonas perspica]|nr:DEAD/DEAH box helicase [Panacagrimonas perspica]